ncbi:MAG: SGNH/GDSL hydrolase family protein [Lachnospiraceae bacterium]|nr:SGNH/GDSL hydrolase family protein [Lachnospiraceae bacterium]
MKRVHLLRILCTIFIISMLLLACTNNNISTNANVRCDVECSVQEGKFLFIGDSYCESEYGWANKLANVMGLSDEQWDKKGISGAGFSTTSENGYVLLDACNQVISTYTDAEKQAVTCVVLIGGINDTNPLQDTSAVKDNVIDCCNALKTAFPNAILYGGTAYNSNSFTGNQMEVVSAIRDGMTEGGMIYMSDLHLVLLGRNSLISNDAVHPTEDGYALLASNIYQFMNGSRFFSFDKYVVNNDVCTATVNCVLQDGQCSIYGSFTPKVASGDFLDLSNTPYKCNAMVSETAIYGYPADNVELVVNNNSTLSFNGVTNFTHPYDFMLTFPAGINSFQ